MALSATRTRRIEFKTGKIITRTRKATAQAFDTVARKMTADVRRKISKPHPPPSRPGAHPHKRSGTLKREFEVIRKGFNLIVRVPQYGIWLEGGTTKMRARPFIRRNLMTPDKKRTWTRRINAEIRKNVNRAKNR